MSEPRLLRSTLLTVVAGAVLAVGTLALPEPPPGPRPVPVEARTP